MGIETMIGVLGFMGTLLLVLVGLLNFSVFRKQLRIAKEQIDTAVRQLEIAQKQPDLYLIQPNGVECDHCLSSHYLARYQLLSIINAAGCYDSGRRRGWMAAKFSILIAPLFSPPVRPTRQASSHGPKRPFASRS